MSSLPPFAFAFDPSIATVCVTLRGRWTLDTVAFYAEVVRTHIRATPPGLAPRNALYDLRNCHLHSRAVADALAEFHATTTGGVARVAVVSTSAVEALQARRISSGTETRTFPTPEAARAWISEASADRD